MVQSRIERVLRVLGPAMVAAVVLPSAALAQDAPAQPPGNPTWVKICSQEPSAQKQLCQVIQQMTAETGRFIASVNIRTLQGESKKQFVAGVLVPRSGALVDRGMRAQIDDGKQYELAYSICYPEVCFAHMEVDEAFITAMKAGGELNLILATQTSAQQSQNQEVKPIALALTLVGFTKAYDGEGIDPVAAQAANEDLAKSLQERADQLGQKLREQQQKATGDAAQ